MNLAGGAMEKRFWNKMVRDKVIPELERKGIICEYENVSDDIAVTRLIEKLKEENLEFDEAQTPKDKLQEAADVVQVCRSIFKKISDNPRSYPMGQGIQVQMLNIELTMVESVKILKFTTEQLEEEISVKAMLKGKFDGNFYLISTLENKKDSA